MQWLNYHHLFYFWTVAKHGSITRASAELHLAHPTISGQILRLQEVLGEKLFSRRGRNLVLTDAGRLAFRYADDIFSLGREFMDALAKGTKTVGKPMQLVVGTADVLPASLVRRFIEPAFQLAYPVEIECRADRSVDEFLADLAIHRVDVVLTDGPAPPDIKVRAFNHLLGGCGTTFFAAPKLASTLRRKFPSSLDGSPFLMPSRASGVWRVLDQWFSAQGIRPTIAGTFDDVGLAKEFGDAGIGVFGAPAVIEKEILRRYRVQVVGRTEAVRQEFYAISVERKLRHPAVVAICEVARKDIFERASKRAGAERSRPAIKPRSARGATSD